MTPVLNVVREYLTHQWQAYRLGFNELFNSTASKVSAIATILMLGITEFAGDPLQIKEGTTYIPYQMTKFMYGSVFLKLVFWRGVNLHRPQQHE